MPQEVPTPEQYRGRRLRSFLEAISAQLRRQRVIVHPGSGLVANETPGGTELRVEAFGVGIAIVKTTSSITARSGTTPGTGSAVLVTWDGSNLGTGTSIALKHISATAAGSGRYGFAAKVFGVWWLVSVEC